MLGKKLAVATMTGVLALTGTSAFAESKSTSLSNGTLTISEQDGCQVTGNCSLFYSSTSYKKTGGSKVDIRLGMTTSDEMFLDTWKTISKGQTVSHSWGGLKKSRVSDCTIVGYMKASTGDYYTPPVNVC
ncbi:hypothetical protein [Streptomyces chartreusis]|uniref:hypothetical protein n=1 Tax=Streptomyces chartreusis TaxID=1969 RepID=UPI0033B5BEBB